MSTMMFLERTFDPPITDEDVHAGARMGGECLDLHKVEWRGSLLAGDGRRLVCTFAAPDAESVRIALRQLRVRGTLWPGSVHLGPSTAAPNVVVERTFEAPVDIGDLQQREDAAAACLDHHRVAFLCSFFALDRRRMLCLYSAPDAESVRLVQRQVELPFERIWTCTGVLPTTGVSAASP